MEYTALLSLLSETMSISGQEYRAHDTLKTHLAPLFDEYQTDALGNHYLIRRGGAKNAKKLLLDAHFDEIGMMVSEITEGGFLKVCAVGGLDLRTLQATPVLIYGDEVLSAVIASTPPHLQSGKERSLLDADEILIDTGYSKQELEEKGVGIGTPIGFATTVRLLQSGRICGRGFDNKASCAAAICAAAEAKLPKDWDVYVLLSAKEEIGGACARTAGASIQPDAALVIDGNIGRVEGTHLRETVALGSGVSISLSCVTDRTLTERCITYAKDASIPYQRIAEATSTGTNADLLALAHHGIPCAVVSIPLRHMHTPCEVIALSDAKALTDLLKVCIERGLCN